MRQQPGVWDYFCLSSTTKFPDSVPVSAIARSCASSRSCKGLFFCQNKDIVFIFIR